MLDFLDDILAELLGSHVPGMAKGRVSFAAPDQQWRGQVANRGEMLNVYLIELRENRDLRSAERFTEPVNGGYRETTTPSRLDCQYLVSAWSPVQTTTTVESAIDEQVLLYHAARVLMEGSPLDANAIYGPAGLPTDFPDALLQPPLPTVVAPPNGFAKLPDFWMRMDHPWKPVVELVVTVPVLTTPRRIGPPVSTLAARFQAGKPATTEELITIGGLVRNQQAVIAGAWVRLVELDRTATTDNDGRFIFAGLTRGPHTLEARAVGHRPAARPVQVPSYSGDYDLVLQPLP